MASADRPLSVIAAEFVALQAPVVRRHAGSANSQRLADHALAVRAACGGSVQASGAQMVMVVCDFSKECISLPERIMASSEAAALDDGEADWSFGPAVAQVVAAGIASVAGLLELNLVSETHGSLNQVTELLMDLSKEIDSVSQYLFSGLCRAEASRQCEELGEDQLLQSSLQSICAWTLVAVGRVMGYPRLTADALWEWGSRDALWVLVLAKGALALDGNGFVCSNAAELPGLECLAIPSDLEAMQLAVTKAILNMASPSIAFCSEVDGIIEEQVSITHRAAQLSCHQAQLAMTIAESQLLGPLLAASSRLSSDERPLLASFIVSMLQPELCEEPAWADSAFGAEVHGSALEAGATLGLQLMWFVGELWALLASAAAAGHTQPAFLKDCGHLAFATLTNEPRSLANALRILRYGIASCQNVPNMVAALTMLAANAGIAPANQDFEDAGLSQLLQQLHFDVRLEVLQHVKAWRGPIRKYNVLTWLQLLQVEANEVLASVEAKQEQPAPQVVPSLQPPVPVATKQLPGTSAGGMRDLLVEAPTDLRCTLDGKLVTDPVRAPSGHIFERSVLARALVESGGCCPLTGQPLLLQQCARDAEVRRKAVAWVRERRGAK